MSTATSHVNSYSRYVGRVGALAAALGIGMMVATSPGVAHADEIGAGSTSNNTSTNNGSDSNAASTGAGAATTGPAESGTTTTAGSATAASTAAAADGANNGSASSVQLAPALSIGVNGIKLGGHAVTVGVNSFRPLFGFHAPQRSSQVVGDPTESAQGSTSGATTGTGQQLPTLAKQFSKPSHSAPAIAVESALDGNGPTLATSASRINDALASVKDAVTKVEPSTVASLSRTTTGLVAPTAATAAATLAPTAPTAPVRQISTGVVSFLNQVVTNLLNPFLKPAPNTPEPVTPVVWAVLAWVRRNAFNQAPTFSQPVTSVQTGQTVTGSLGATDPENDTLTYTVTKAPEHGQVTINQQAGTYTYTPTGPINYDAVKTDSFTVSVTDGNKVNLLGLSQPRTAEREVAVTLQPPTVDRVILNMPGSVKNPVNPRYSADGKSIYFSGTPTVGGRQEIYQISATDVDGSTVNCLTCGLAAPTVTGTPGGRGDTVAANALNLQKPVPFEDGSGRVLVLQDNPGPRYTVYEPVGYNGNTQARLVPVVTPDGGGQISPPGTINGIPTRFIFPDGVVDRQREMRVSPDGNSVLFTRIVIGQTGNFQAIPIVGTLEDPTPGNAQYTVSDAVVVWPTGEGKQWTHDGKSVIIQGGAIDAGNIDDISVDVSGRTGTALFPGSPSNLGTRVTANPDYEEDIDMSPNGQWIAVGSTRGFDALTPDTRIQRENFLPVYLAGVYTDYADNQQRNVSNQTWAVAEQDELNGVNGIPLFVQDDPTTPVDEGDGWAARSMPSWNTDGTAVTFWESGNADEHGIPVTQSRLVIANLKYTTSVAPPLTAAQKQTVFDPSKFQALKTYVAQTTPLPPANTTYPGPKGGTAVVTEVVTGSGLTAQTTRTVTYHDYVNKDGLVLNGTESAIYGADQNSSTYNANIDVTDAVSGANRGYLHANNVLVQTFPTQVVGAGADGRGIESSLDGNVQKVPDQAKAEAAKEGA